jgi:glycosyltransferase involved in cell wall biosynthesis
MTANATLGAAMAPLPPARRACTIVARNYLAQAQVLARSFRAHNPDVHFYTLVIDADGSEHLDIDVGTIVTPYDLGLDADVLHPMLAKYDVIELATALKPAMLMWLVRLGSESVAYFDPDIRVFAPLDDVFADAAQHGILLTPHTIEPIPRDGRQLNERVIMQAGIYNLGFIAVGAQRYRFLAWWHERLRTDAIVHVAEGLFTDQRWIDWVPSLFGAKISRDRGLNAAYWNLHERAVSRRDGRWYVGDDVLRFFHFSGYDPELPWLLSKHMGQHPRILLSERPDLQSLCDSYGAELIEVGHPQLRKNRYRLERLPNGSLLHEHFRRTYRDVLIGELEVASDPPDPIADCDAFVAWMLGPMFEGALASLSVAEYGWWRARSDVRAMFPDVLGVHGRLFKSWLSADDDARSAFRDLAGRPFMPEVGHRPRRPDVSSSPLGWSVVAYARSELGVGEAGRRMASAVALSGLPYELVGVPLGNLSRQRHDTVKRISDQITFDNAIVCVNADQVPRIDTVLGLGGFDGVRAGLWFWELSEFPDQYAAAFDRFHEVWVASEFNRAAIQAATDKTVRLVRLPMHFPAGQTRHTRRSVGLPENAFVFLSNFDYLSVHRRKNPIGAIEAYLRAFGPDDGAVLVVKSINGQFTPLHVEEVRHASHGRSDVVFIDSYASSSMMQAMIELADVYVSLHRSEGYGLNMADAMARRTPVVATAYSGNLDFMDAETAALVGFDLVEVGKGSGPYDPGSVWADPDLDAAAAAMRRLFDDRAYGSALADRADRHVRRHFAPERIGELSRELLLTAAACRQEVTL